jgi:pimeloyl-ACP methyl ester carboxylesterase
VARLALLDTGARAESPEQTQMRRPRIELARAGHVAEVSDSLFPILVHPNRHNDEVLKRLMRTMAEEVGAEAFLRQQQAIMARPDSRPGLSAITCPTLVLVGDGDAATPPALSQEIAGAIPAARLVVVPDCGHMSTLERPQAVAEALVDWMRS